MGVYWGSPSVVRSSAGTVLTMTSGILPALASTFLGAPLSPAAC